LARRIPGKEEFAETLRYFGRRLELTGVKVSLGHRVSAAELVDGGWDEVVLATGVTPRSIDLPGADRPNVHGYADVITGAAQVGDRVAIIGAGGIGFDVAELLTTDRPSGEPQSVEDWMAEWGVADPAVARGGLAVAVAPNVPRRVVLLQRKESKVGAGLGKTTGWVHRSALKQRGVEMVRGVTYDRIDDAGLHVRVGDRARLIEVDDVVVCAGQESQRELLDELLAAGVSAHVVGGAEVAAELDAKRAIAAATRFAAAL
jgi:2,4-dienoyl-CoA reductase (NADPH2)